MHVRIIFEKEKEQMKIVLTPEGPHDVRKLKQLQRSLDDNVLLSLPFGSGGSYPGRPRGVYNTETKIASLVLPLYSEKTLKRRKREKADQWTRDQQMKREAEEFYKNWINSPG